MKIYLNDRMIFLSSSRPEIKSRFDLISEYSSIKKLRIIFEEFEKDEKIRSLLLYSKNNYSSLEKDFFSLFKVIDAAGGLVFNENHEKLFIFRYGKWDLPKGKMHKKEKPEEAALREVMEETGLKRVTITHELPPTYHIYYLKSDRILKHTHWFAMTAHSSEPLIPQTGEDISIVRWVAKDGLSEILSNTYSSLEDLIRS